MKSGELINKKRILIIIYIYIIIKKHFLNPGPSWPFGSKFVLYSIFIFNYAYLEEEKSKKRRKITKKCHLLYSFEVASNCWLTLTLLF